MRVLGLVGLALVAGLVVINSACMLVSPKAWFRLPGWLTARGSLTKEQYSTGSGALSIRITGAVMLAAILWILYDMLTAAK
jgi:hypothetical protein